MMKNKQIHFIRSTYLNGEDKLKGIRNFIECYENPDEVRQILWSIIFAAMDSNIADSWGRTERTDTLIFYELATNLVIAVYQLFEAGSEAMKNVQ